MTSKSKFIDSTFRILSEEIPGVSTEDIVNLMSILETLAAKNETDTTLENFQIKQWVPPRRCVLEILAAEINPQDVKVCIEDFRDYADSRNWAINDNLNSKFIAHCKIMLSNGKIKKGYV